jgi:excisionase family DNA binding protein
MIGDVKNDLARNNTGKTDMAKTDVESDTFEKACRTISVEEAAIILGISRATAYTSAKTGALPTIRLGKRLLVPKAALEKLLASA